MKGGMCRACRGRHCGRGRKEVREVVKRRRQQPPRRVFFLKLSAHGCPGRASPSSSWALPAARPIHTCFPRSPPLLLPSPATCRAGASSTWHAALSASRSGARRWAGATRPSSAPGGGGLAVARWDRSAATACSCSASCPSCPLCHAPVRMVGAAGKRPSPLAQPQPRPSLAPLLPWLVCHHHHHCCAARTTGTPRPTSGVPSLRPAWETRGLLAMTWHSARRQAAGPRVAKGSAALVPPLAVTHPGAACTALAGRVSLCLLLPRLQAVGITPHPTPAKTHKARHTAVTRPSPHPVAYAAGPQHSTRLRAGAGTHGQAGGGGRGQAAGRA